MADLRMAVTICCRYTKQVLEQSPVLCPYRTNCKHFRPTTRCAQSSLASIHLLRVT